MAAEDFDRARHRLRQEVAARDAAQPGGVIDLTAGQWDALAREGLRAKWAGADEPEQADRDMMANYNRCVIAEAAHTTRPIDWFKVAAWAVAGLFSLAAWAVAGLFSLAAWALIGRWLR